MIKILCIFAIVLYRLSKVNYKLNNIEKSIEQLKHVLSILNSIYKEYNEIIDTVSYRLAEIHYEKKDLQQVKELLINIANERHALYGIRDDRVHIIMHSLAHIYHNLGN